MDKLFRQTEYADLYRCFSKVHDCINLSRALSAIAADYELTLASTAEKGRAFAQLGQFDSLKGHEEEHIINVFKVKRSNQSFDLLIIGIDFSGQRSAQSRGSVVEYEMLALVNQSKDLGKIFISPESIIDKISEFFNPVEIDFPEDKVFSDKYYVLSSDPEKVRKSLDANLRLAIAGFDDLYIETSGSKIILRVQDEISADNAKKITHAAFGILRA